MRLTKRAQFLVDNLDLPRVSGVESARWEGFQIAQLCNNSAMRIENKSRQIAWSFLCSLEATAEAMLDGQSSFFVSINRDEAIEKIRYARLIEDNLRLHVRGLPKLVVDNQLGLEYDNGARLMSLPSKAPRGKARFNVYLDEFAHVMFDKDILTGAMGVITKGGRLRIGSSPFGASGKFWEIFTESLRPYPGFTRVSTPWWHCHGLCVNVKDALKNAYLMSTEERVSAYAKPVIQDFYANMLIEDFEQEFECSFNDVSSALIGFEEIRKSSSDDLLHFKADCKGANISVAKQAIDELIKAKLESAFAVGIDVGRTRNATEIFAVGLSTVNSYPLRLMITLTNVDFDDQFDVISYLVYHLPVTKCYIDHNGLGMNLAENLAKKFPHKVEGVTFTNASKSQWATNAKMLISQGKTPLPLDRDLAYQINSIKKIVTPSKNLVFDTDKNEKHHADKFWAWALALAAAMQSIVTKPKITHKVVSYNPKSLY